MRTREPALEKRRAASRPMPLDPPVMTTRSSDDDILVRRRDRGPGVVARALWAGLLAAAREARAAATKIKAKRRVR
jgi:hypothetical protein